jgi:ribose-phosphate pyrophosphokinase
MIADLLEAVGIAHVVTVDLHSAEIEGFFYVPVDTLTAVPTLCRELRECIPPDTVVVSPDAGRVQLATNYAQCLGAPLVVLHKRRESGTETEVIRIVGEMTGRAYLIVDDIISTGGTIADSIHALLTAGARPEMFVAATHGLLLRGTRQKLDQPAVREIFVTDTVCPNEALWPRVRVISIAPLIAGALKRFLTDGSLRDLYPANPRSPAINMKEERHATGILS